ncbi:hypothetical protein B9Z65_7323 [Elsinoe australis]|uniref:Uncharacterized protein n=1 Tax=Elsinoe australis TaxID=40998 RepID=A0A2P7YBU1_9PEZI|nr:hypothetical protein B9Z65_7323 [Elsinoe australis]
MVTLAIKDAANGVAADSGDSANIIGITNNTSSKTYVQSNQGQGPSESGPDNRITPATCTATKVEYSNANNYFPNIRGVKATCKVACKNGPFLDGVIGSVLNKFFDGIRSEGSFMSEILLWSFDSKRARVRCRLTIANNGNNIDGCPDYVPNYGCFANEEEIN